MPHGLSLSTILVEGQQTHAPRSGCHEVRKSSEKMLASFLTADAGRIGEEGEAAFPAWNSWSPERFGDLVALRNTKGSSRTDD